MAQLRSRVTHVVDNLAQSRLKVMQWLTQAGREVRTFASLGEYVRGRCERPDCIVAGLSARERENLAIGHADRPGEARSAVVFLAHDAEIELAVSAMKAGAFDVLPFTGDAAAILEAIDRAVCQSDAWLGDHSRLQRAETLLGRLTPRERAIFVRILRGERNKQIAAVLDSREATVKVHRSRLMRKLEARTLAQLLQLGRELEGRLEEAEDQPVPSPRPYLPAPEAPPRRPASAILAVHAEQARIQGAHLSSWAALYRS